jgi:D-tyrosyl-tRNA(Tyr) deacylase
LRFVIQNVTEGNVSIDGQIKGSVGRGFVVLIGIAQTDNEQIADKMIDKMFRLRVFEDENGKTNLNLEQVDGGLLLVSQFTLYADVKSGNRPGFSRACKPDRASELYDYIVEECHKRNDKVGTGEFGADMKVSLVNDGPFTIILDSDELSF